MRVIVLITLLSIKIFASLAYLERSTQTQTAFENVTNYFQDDHHTANAKYDDSIDKDVDIGFSFPFNGSTYQKVTIGSNGYLYFQADDYTKYKNKELPIRDIPQSIYAYWDDINIGDTNDGTHGTIKYGTVGSGDNKHFVVEWKDAPHYPDKKKYSFQVVLYQDGTIRLRYDNNSDADGTSFDGSDEGATIGVQEDTSHYDQYSYNSQIDKTKDVVYSPVPPPTDNEYSDFHFDELEYNGDEKEVRDSHWNKHGVGHNVPLIKGKICNGADLRANGTQDYIKLNEIALDGAKSFTISVWNKSKNSDSNALLSGATDGSDNEILFWMSNSTKFDGHIKNNQKKITTQNFDDGKWHHLVWRLDGSKSCFFFDGVKQGCKNYSQSYTLHIKSLILGQDQDNVGGKFDKNQDWEGIIDELLIFRKALSDSEIADIYNNQNAGKNWDGTDRVCPYPNAIKTSCVVSDPVNNTSNPKRIPGAKIRYAIEVKNPNTSTAHDVLVKDSVDNSFDTSTISNLKISNNNCNCQNPSNLSNNGSNGSSDGQNPVKLDLGNIDGGKSKCGYFEVEIK